MGDRDTGIGGGGRGGGHPRHDLKGHAGGRQLLHLLAASAEDEGIASLQPDHHLALHGVVHQHLVDLFLGMGVLHAALLTRIDQFGVLRDMAEQPGAGQVIIDDDFRPLEQLPAPDRNQAGIPRACPNQIDLPRSVFFRLIFHT